jgi:2'-5' RNA ligase/phage I-like protein
MARYDHIDFTPPQGAREAAKRALEVRAEKPESQRGMTPIGIARARDLSNGKRLSPATVRRMLAYFDRHQSDKDGQTWGEQGAGWQAWNGWGGDPGYAWARKVVRQLDAADKAATMSDGPHTSVCVVLTIPEEIAEYVALDDKLDAHLTLVHLGDAASLGGNVELVRGAVERWAAETPPLPARFSGLACFAGDDADACVLLVDAPGLSAVRDDLARRLRNLGLPVSASHGFTPHVTLAYLAKGAELPSLPYDLPLAFTLEAASVWAADTHHEPIALTGTADPATLSALDEPALFRGEPQALVFDAKAPVAVGHTTWNQIARLGTFRGHPQGPVEFTAKVFEEIRANLAATKNGEVPGDFEHFSERPPPEAAVTGVPAPFWVTDVEIRGETLWAAFKWVDARAVEMVRTEQYKYVSPAIAFNARSRETGLPIGARLTSVALTNHPFLDGMAPITASATSRRFSPSPESVHAPSFGTKNPEKIMQQNEIKPGAEMASQTPSAPVAEAPKAAAPEVDAKAVAASDAEMSAHPAYAMGAKMARAEMLKRMATTCGMDGFNPDLEHAEDALHEQLRAKLEELAMLQQKERAAAEAEAAQMSDRAIAAGLADAEARADLVALCLSDRARFSRLYPEKRIAQAEGAKLMSERGSTTRAQADVLLSNLGAGGGSIHATAPAGGLAYDATRLDARAQQIAAEHKIDLFTARVRAEQELAAASR